MRAFGLLLGCSASFSKNEKDAVHIVLSTGFNKRDDEELTSVSKKKKNFFNPDVRGGLWARDNLHTR